MADGRRFVAALTTTLRSRNCDTMRIEIDQSDPSDIAAAIEMANTSYGRTSINKPKETWA
jgi:hypothetical protein